MENPTFIDNANNLLNLSKKQSRIRTLIRALWIGLAGLNFVWSADLIWNLKISWLIKIAFAIMCAGYFIYKTIFYKTDMNRFLWRVDRLLNTKEQISTAWMVSKKETQSRLDQELINEASQLTSEISQRVLTNGWYLQKEIVSLLLMSLLFFTLLISGGQAQYQTYQASQASLLPPINTDPGIEEVFDGRVPDMEGEPGESSEQGDGEQGSTGANELLDSLKENGSSLANSHETQELGTALENGDINKAADELEKLADNFGDLSKKTKQDLAKIMEKSGESIAELGMQEMAEQFNQTANAINGAENSIKESSASKEAQKEMKESAQDMRALAEQLNMMSLFGETTATSQQNVSGGGAGSGTGATENSEPEPVERLQGEGETMELQVNETSESGLLNPNPPVGTGTSTAQGAFGLINFEEGTSSSVLTLYTYPYEWQTVISNYFLHGD